MPETTIEPCLLTKKQLITTLGISGSTIEIWMDDHRIPYLQLGGVLRFDLKKVLDALSAYEVPALPKEGPLPMPRRPGRPKKNPTPQLAEAT